MKNMPKGKTSVPVKATSHHPSESKEPEPEGTPEEEPVTPKPVIAVQEEGQREEKEQKTPAMINRILASSAPLNVLVLSLSNASQQAIEGRFPPHPGLIAAMMRAASQGDEELFLAYLHDYVEQAQNHVARFLHTTYYRDVVLPEIEHLLHEEGIAFSLIARRILAFQNIPV